MLENTRPLESLLGEGGDVNMVVDGSFAIVICYTVCDLPAQFIELFAPFVGVILLLSLMSHRGEERLDGGVKLVPQLRGENL